MPNPSKLPKDRNLGVLAKDRSGEKKLTGPIKWKREKPGFYVTSPFRFVLERVEADKCTVEHWKLTDSSPAATYHGKTAKEMKGKAQEVLDIESGKKKKPPEKKKKKLPPYRYEGFFRNGKRVFPDGYEACSACDGEGLKDKLTCAKCRGDGAEKVGGLF